MNKPGITHDDYVGQWVYNGEGINTGSFGDHLLSSVNLYSWLHGTFNDAGQNQSIQLYESISGKGAGGFLIQSASDNTGTTLNVHRVENSHFSNFLGHTMIAPKEVVAIDLPPLR